MKQHFFAHLGSILIVVLLLVVAVFAVQNPNRMQNALQEAFSVASVGEDAKGEAEPSFLSKIASDPVFSDNGVAEWIVVLAMVLVGLVAGKLVGAITRRIGDAQQERGWIVRGHVIGDAAGPLNLALFTLGIAIGLAVLNMGPALTKFLRQTVELLYTIAAVWYVYNLIALIDVGFERLRGRNASKLDQQLVPLIRRSLRVVLLILAVMYTADSIYGQDVKTWLAGLGIAGLAISLAAQDSLKNFFGSITILLDRPFKVGERIVCSGHDGVIQDIGFRSTKIRTGDGHLVTIPNANIVNSPVENIGARPFIKRTLNVTITYDTPREKIAEGVSILKSILAEDGIREPIHPTINGDTFPPRVYFNDYNAESLNLIVIYWYAPPAYWDYMEHGERVNLRIFEEFEKAGIDMAFPTQTLYLVGDEKRKLAVEMLGRDLKAS
jgi:MscS family membrane protein